MALACRSEHGYYSCLFQLCDQNKQAHDVITRPFEWGGTNQQQISYVKYLFKSFPRCLTSLCRSVGYTERLPAPVRNAVVFAYSSNRRRLFLRFRIGELNMKKICDDQIYKPGVQKRDDKMTFILKAFPFGTYSLIRQCTSRSNLHRKSSTSFVMLF